MDTTVNHYERLGVARDASHATIREAYRARARAAHPDATGSLADDEMAAINDAWYVLRDPDRRRRYDASLAVDGGPTASTAWVFVDPPEEERSDDDPVDTPTARALARLITASLLAAGAAAIVFLLVAFLEGY